MSELEDKQRGLVRLDDKVALVIGAGSGIGLASAQVCAEAGAQVMLEPLPLGGRQGLAQVLGHHLHHVAADQLDLVRRHPVMFRRHHFVLVSVCRSMCRSRIVRIFARAR